MEFALGQEGFIDMDIQPDAERGTLESYSIITELSATTAVSDALVQKFGLDVESMEIEWQPHTYSELKDSQDHTNLEDIVTKLKHISDVKAIYTNAKPWIGA